MDWDTMARGLLMLSPRLMLIPTCSMVDMVDMDWDTMARGPLMLMPSPLLILTSMVDTMAMVRATMVAMDMAVDTTGDKSSHQQGNLDIHQDPSVNHQLLCQQKMDSFSLSFIPHQCCQFQCCQPSHARNGEQEAIENQNVLIRKKKSKTKKK